MASLKEAAKDDPIGAAIIIMVAALFVVVLAYSMRLQDWALEWPGTPPMQVAAKPKIPPPPAEWFDHSSEHDVLRVSGWPVIYWANPHAEYSRSASTGYRKPVGIVMHYTGDKPVLNLVKYGQRVDEQRGGSFGYHWYIAKDGTAVQGAPLTKRTNHIKPPGHPARKSVAPRLSNTDSVGIALVGGCQVEDTPIKPVTLRCIGDEATPEQIGAAMAIIEALRARFDIPCQNVWGHGELQHDRSSFEGTTVATMARQSCRQEMASVN